MTKLIMRVTVTVTTDLRSTYTCDVTDGPTDLPAIQAYVVNQYCLTPSSVRNLTVQVTREPCIHEGLFATNPPSEHSARLKSMTYAEVYKTWLNATKRCTVCGDDVPNRDL